MELGLVIHLSSPSSVYLHHCWSPHSKVLMHLKAAAFVNIIILTKKAQWLKHSSSWSWVMRSNLWPHKTMVFNNPLLPWHNSTPCSLLLSPSDSRPCSTHTHTHTHTHTENQLTGRGSSGREPETAEQSSQQQSKEEGLFKLGAVPINTAGSKASQGVRRPNGRLGLLPGSIDRAITLPLSCLPQLTSPSS